MMRNRSFHCKLVDKLYDSVTTILKDKPLPCKGSYSACNAVEKEVPSNCEIWLKGGAMEIG
jgi:hypothetical protein